ncbi:LacI family transcriptional regulator [Albidovulum inexpectatum]|uniref:LacI family transcriptional regulator n=1 Tax=Albidovulum inexpectatum TaxID=196587 RepID=A0A2S5JHC8_9RHOB|nr:LacI family DNA-binding transcriptional regulator [Albidovulum inexpectatum]PPB80862.1 LacI family transcriptional regulator [Albidovulum inexpectatum]
MTERPTLADVARNAGVSIATASQALRGTGRISRATREKVARVAREIRYVPDLRAAAMRSGDNREIGFVINQLHNPFNAEVVSGAVDLLERQNYLVSIFDMRDDVARQDRQLQAFIRHGRGGVLWVPALDTPDEAFELLRAHGIPTVTFLRNPGQNLDHVGIRNAEALQTAVDHLADLGHKDIAYLGGQGMGPVRRDRIAGYRRQMAERGLAAPIIWDSDDTKQAGLVQMQALMRDHPQVTAVVCNGDMVAIGACLALVRMGIQPSREVSVIGFDDTEEAALVIPPLTTLSVAPYKLGQKLAQTLLDRIADPQMPPVVAEVSARLVTRATTGAPQR